MPSSKNYVRDYEQEAKTMKQRGQDEDNAQRTKLRREAIKKGVVARGDGKDLDHKQALSKGGANTLSNARPVDPGTNRSFARNPDGSMKSQVSARERSKK